MPNHVFSLARPAFSGAALTGIVAAVVGGLVWVTSPDASATRLTPSHVPATRAAAHDKPASHARAAHTKPRTAAAGRPAVLAAVKPRPASVAVAAPSAPLAPAAVVRVPKATALPVAVVRTVPVVTHVASSPSPVRRTTAPAPAPLHSTNVVPAGTPLTASTCNSAYPELTAADQWLFDTLNAERVSHGKPALRWDPRLHMSACLHNVAMGNANTLSHQLSSEKGLGDRVSAQSVRWSIAAENIGWYSDMTGSGIPAATWINTDMMNEGPGGDHYDNIMSPANYVGVSVVLDAAHGRVWVTEDFAGE